MQTGLHGFVRWEPLSRHAQFPCPEIPDTPVVGPHVAGPCGVLLSLAPGFAGSHGWEHAALYGGVCTQWACKPLPYARR